MRLTIKLVEVDKLPRFMDTLCMERDEIMTISFMQESNSSFGILQPYLLSDERLKPGDRYWNKQHKMADPVVDNLHAAVLNKGEFRKVLKTPEEFSTEELKYIVDNDLQKFEHYVKRDIHTIETEKENQGSML